MHIALCILELILDVGVADEESRGGISSGRVPSQSLNRGSGNAEAAASTFTDTGANTRGR